MPDVVYADLFFEYVDDKKDPPDWWGVQIIRLLKQGPFTEKIPIFVESKFIEEPVFKTLEDLGVPRTHVKSFSTLRPEVILDYLNEASL